MTDASIPSEVRRFLSSHAPIESAARCADGTRIGIWRVTGFVGRGGSAEVYRVVDESVGREGALKIMRDDCLDAVRNAKRRERFAHEIRILKKLGGGCFPILYDAGVFDGSPYLVEEYLLARPLPSTDRDAAAFLIAVAEGVTRLHAAGLVHRDLKPANILCRADGSLVIIDLALSKMFETTVPRKDSLSVLDGRRVGVGTAGYAAPEQLTGDEVSPATDVHALGCLVRDIFGDKVPHAWREIMRRATSSVATLRYPTPQAFIRAVRHRHAARYRTMIGSLFVIALCVVCWYGGLGRGVGRAETIWDDLVSRRETNRVDQVLVSETLVTNRVGRADIVMPKERRWKTVTNRVEVNVVNLGGRTNVLTRPLHLTENQEYWVIGPGRIDAIWADTQNVTMRLWRCEMRNGTTRPIDKAGIQYILEEESRLVFPNLDEPFDTSKIIKRRDGYHNEVRFDNPRPSEYLPIPARWE